MPPECRDGRLRKDLACPNCMKKGTVRQTADFLQCCSWWENRDGKLVKIEGCGFGGWEKDFWKVAEPQKTLV